MASTVTSLPIAEIAYAEKINRASRVRKAARTSGAGATAGSVVGGVVVEVSTRCEGNASHHCCEEVLSDILMVMTESPRPRRRIPQDADPASRDTPYGRRISDPGALRALAHAGRYAILERLQTQGPATATEVAAVAGLSPSACSYHLRLLARHGFVEESPAGDGAVRDGRERVWRAAIAGWWNDPEPGADPREVQAVDSTLSRVMLASSDAKVLDFVDRGARERDWRDAALFSNSTIAATVEELDALGQAMMDLLRPLMMSNRPVSEAPEGARMVHLAIRMAPYPPESAPTT
jgi:DNA-binding transcriptional ArsR family regulator